ncbi:MetQ/NlpA family ABC transporter substrate-binding protein [Campylobacter sp. faydin G-24]|uniref:MetQ/NlpA family ABC transporter substrate-binding protein n=1 Tax=Campylobacter anatolicus TaxID=2829105 RepID=A0ABS5HJT5_9BACT|nr:MetQ/NlpA family ABC transporter substrate-binding protein [Campylobacter anatolicus]MBR8462813.1 MetQ/NlpA family ABC transporter substrate-binding protein [Campylobacter anatolicus]MBR8463887.1 MetQ/NlpA family ABC transporter substrate-binding protein [Campylobacter anatolicus]
MKISKVLLLPLLTLWLNAAGDEKTIIIGASPVPHAEILEEVVAPLLAEDGYKLIIKIFNDYVIPNLAVEQGDLDANYFQGLPYMKSFNKEKGTHIVPTVGVHIEPLGIYSKKIKSLNELKNGDIVAISNNVADSTRSINLLEKVGLVKAKDGEYKSPLDIIKNPKNLKFKEMESAQTPRSLSDVTIAFINVNYALDVGLSPTNDSLLLEGSESNYVNYVAVKEGNENLPKIQALNKAILSSKVKEFILSRYKGAAIPAF